MADYFEEMGWTPLGEGESPDHLLHFVRLLRDFGMSSELEEKRLPPPASKEAVKNLERDLISETRDDLQCRVCLKSYEKSELVIKLPCKHIFHETCISPWLDKTNSCPLCRYELPTDDENYEQYRMEKIRAEERKKDLENLHNSMFS